MNFSRTTFDQNLKACLYISKLRTSIARLAVAALLINSLSACTPFWQHPVTGPDKEIQGTVLGAGLGAGAGAAAAHTLTNAAGPEGALIGMGFGAFYGWLTGLSHDLIEENQLYRKDQEQVLKDVAWAQDLLTQHYQRRLELHPSRDIFPADWFFDGDSSELRPEAEILVNQIAHMTRKRMPWSRIVIASYSTSSSPDSEYSTFINKRRASSIARGFITSGVEPRRVFTKSITRPDPVLLDPYDDPFRYRQAIEIIPLDY